MAPYPWYTVSYQRSIGFIYSPFGYSTISTINMHWNKEQCLPISEKSAWISFICHIQNECLSSVLVPSDVHCGNITSNNPCVCMFFYFHRLAVQRNIWNVCMPRRHGCWTNWVEFSPHVHQLAHTSCASLCRLSSSCVIAWSMLWYVCNAWHRMICHVVATRPIDFAGHTCSSVDLVRLNATKMCQTNLEFIAFFSRPTARWPRSSCSVWSRLTARSAPTLTSQLASWMLSPSKRLVNTSVWSTMSRDVSPSTVSRLKKLRWAHIFFIFFCLFVFENNMCLVCHSDHLNSF